MYFLLPKSFYTAQTSNGRAGAMRIETLRRAGAVAGRRVRSSRAEPPAPFPAGGFGCGAPGTRRACRCRALCPCRRKQQPSSIYR